MREYWIKAITILVIGLLSMILIYLGFLTMANGGITVTHYGECYKCNGSGMERYRTCYVCNGSGIGAWKSTSNEGIDIVFFGLGLAGLVYSLWKSALLSAERPLYTKPKHNAQEREAQKKDSQENVIVKATDLGNGKWRCGNCQTENSTNYSQCKKCGKYRG